MRIDAHQHFWRMGHLEYAWMPPEPSVLRQDFLPERLEPILRRNRFDGSVVVQATSSLDETRWNASLGQGFFSDPIDKVITSFVVFIVLAGLSRRLIARFPLGERSVGTEAA